MQIVRPQRTGPFSTVSLGHARSRVLRLKELYFDVLICGSSKQFNSVWVNVNLVKWRQIEFKLWNARMFYFPNVLFMFHFVEWMTSMGILARRIHQTTRFLKNDSAGGLLPRPYTLRFAVPKLIILNIGFVWSGSLLSQYCAQLLEELDVFIMSETEEDDE